VIDGMLQLVEVLLSLTSKFGDLGEQNENIKIQFLPLPIAVSSVHQIIFSIFSIWFAQNSFQLESIGLCVNGLLQLLIGLLQA
jgi:hypothetical protein